MQTYRIVPRTAPRACKAACNPAAAAASRNMFTPPFFPTSNYNPVAELAPLFRVLDSAVAELTPSNAERASSHRHHHHQRRGGFSPRFDVKEVGSAYELQGELPGVEQRDLEIEFADERTLVIRGKMVRERESADGVDQTAATPAVEENERDSVTVTADDDGASEKSASYHKASVQDDEDDDDFVDAGAEAEKPDGLAAKGKAAGGSHDAADSETASAVPAAAEKKASEPETKYWVSERAVGEFERRFAFPGRVDQEAVKASLRNGILSVVVPKIVEAGVRRIEIQ